MQVSVISYTRFSTLAQSKGQSLRRQEEKAEQWAAKHGMILDDRLRLRDLGVSAWMGTNTETGALGGLLKMVRAGKLERGTILLIEAMDRLTRQGLDEAIPLFLELLKGGIEIVTLQDEQRYTRETLKDQGKFILAIIYLSGGNRESEIKSERIRDAYEANRKQGKSQIFGSAPGWLTRKDKFHPWELNPEKAAVVRKVFEMVAAGYGSTAIAHVANKEGWVIPTRLAESRELKGWTATMAGKLVRSRAAIGEHEHRNRTREANKAHWEGESRGIVIKDYYPAVVDESLFYQAQAAVDRRRKPQGRDQWYLNVWSGLICCGVCGGGVHRKSDPKHKTQGQLRCRNAAASLCSEPSHPVINFDVPVLNHIAQYASMMLGDADVYVAKLDAQLTKLAEIDAEAERLGASIAKGVRLPAFERQALLLSEQNAELLKEIEKTRKLIAEHTGNLFDTSFADNLFPILYERSESAKESRARANLMLRRVVGKIELFAGEQVAAVSFKDSRERIMVPIQRPAKDRVRYDEDSDTAAPDAPPDYMPEHEPVKKIARRLLNFCAKQ
jgi:DNA invertase Pin-like site-specific DNA recombinase